MLRLALHGGNSVRRGKPWPLWPSFDEGTERAALAAIHERRWAASWPSSGAPSYELRFASAFATYVSAAFAVAVDHGSTAVLLALEAAGVGAGDEVLVPAMTWVASASAVLRAGALPVLVDVDPETGCIDARAAEQAVTSATRAVIVVHLACTVADLDALLAIATRFDLAVVEDCAQAHGAEWRNRQVGTLGDFGAFSFQSGKVLAAGEGGAVTTSSPSAFRTLQQLRADGRTYADDVAPGSMELVVDGTVMGANHCMPEVLAAVALDRLAQLEAQHDRRTTQADELERRLAAEALGIRGLSSHACVTRRSIYELALRVDVDAIGVPVDTLATALTAELERPVYPPHDPLHRSPYFSPSTRPRFRNQWTKDGAMRSVGRSFPGADAYRRSTLLTHHAALLGGEDDIDDFVHAFQKVLANVVALRNTSGVEGRAVSYS
ncbi:MAG: hypothetical protein QOK43_2188 [Acidimicrobiaceae bacterium]|nr:hypothetical protein [Acidimicrobiaceae bacterium]